MNDIDFDQFIKLLDGALASDDKNVKQALRKFLFVAAMVMGDDCEPGPFTEMMDTIDSLQRRVATLENQNTYTTTDNMWATQGIGTAFNPLFTTPSTAGGTSGSITSSGSTTVINPAVTTSTSTITMPNTTTTTAGTIYTISGLSNVTPSTLWHDMVDPKTGTSIKEKIKESLKKLAKLA